MRRRTVLGQNPIVRPKAGVNNRERSISKTVRFAQIPFTFAEITAYMGKQILYRVGQAAKDLGVSSYRLRRLCETGLINAEFSGKQWEIPAGEVERLNSERHGAGARDRTHRAPGRSSPREARQQSPEHSSSVRNSRGIRRTERISRSEMPVSYLTCEVITCAEGSSPGAAATERQPLTTLV